MTCKAAFKMRVTIFVVVLLLKQTAAMVVGLPVVWIKVKSDGKVVKGGLKFA